MTGPCQNEPITYAYWVDTMDSIIEDKRFDEMTTQLAEMCKALVMLGRNDPHVGAYLNQRALKAMEATDGSR